MVNNRTLVWSFVLLIFDIVTFLYLFLLQFFTKFGFYTIWAGSWNIVDVQIALLLLLLCDRLR